MNIANGFDRVAPFWLPQPGADQATIHEVELSLAVQLPKDYCSFLLWSNGGEGWNDANSLSLWKVEELLSLNQDYKIQQYLPLVVCVGTDGGSIGYGLDYCVANTPTMVSFHLGDLDASEVEQIAPNFTEGIITILVNQ